VADNTPKRVERDARLAWVPIEKMRVSPSAQRELNQARVDHIAANFDLEQIGTPVVNEREGHFWIIDGQHRVEALKQIGWGDQQVQCWRYSGLSMAEEAEKFLKLNDVLPVPVMPKYRIAVQAGREIETDIDRIVRAAGLRVTKDKVPGAVPAVGTLRRIYTRSGPVTLRRTLQMVRDSYGDPGMQSAVLDGIGLLCQRYNGELNDVDAVKKLAGVHAGVNGLLGKAENLRRSTGNAKGHCVAAAAVEIINSGRGGKKLPSWWRS
jgi:hypothetical protein